MNRIRKRLVINAKMPPGYNGALTVQETARQLGVTPQRVHVLCKEGRLNPVKVEHRLYIIPEEVRAYRRLQQIWAAAGGRWTPYGREERQPPRPPYRPAERSEEPEHDPLGADSYAPYAPSDPSARPQDQQDRWIALPEAAQLMNVTLSWAHKVARKKGLDRQIRRCRGLRRPRLCVRLRAIQELVNQRESAAWNRATSPRDWNNDLRHPIIRTKNEPPPGDSLISFKDSASYLGVNVPRISNLVAQGILFGWQKQPGRPGSRLYLSARQVMRYAQDPVRLKRRAAATEGSAPSELKTGNDWTEWLDWHGISKYAGCHGDRDRGEFLTTAQAAELMGIATGKVKALRARGRLRGYKRKDGARRWWFFRRDEVEDLLADPEYARRRRAAAKAARTVAANCPPTA